MFDYSKVQTSALVDIIRCACVQPANLFNMGGVIHHSDCGTVGCLLGSWIIHNADGAGLAVNRYATFRWACGKATGPRESAPIATEHCRELLVKERFATGTWTITLKGLAARLGLPVSVIMFLFTEKPPSLLADGLRRESTSAHAVTLTKDEAIGRLTKVLFYVWRKQDLLRNYEAARKIGHAGVTQTVRELVDAKVCAWQKQPVEVCA